MYLTDVLIFVVGLLLLVKGADLFVVSSSRIAERFGVSEFIIRLTRVSIWISVPELASCLTASFEHASGIVIGNVLGSNITNTLLILGCSGLVYPLTVTRTSIYYITPFMLFISLLLLLFIRTGWRIKIYEGLILFLLYSGFMVFIFRLG